MIINNFKEAKLIKTGFVLVAILLSIKFWGYYKFWRFENYINLIAIPLFVICYIQVHHKNNMRFKKAIIIFLIGILLNILSAYLNNGQSIRDTALSFRNFYFILFYFFLHYLEPDRKALERTIMFLAVVSALLYLYQISIFPRRYFAGNIFSDRGTVRMILFGDFSVLGYFLLINRFLLKHKILDLLAALLILYVILLTGYRTFLAASVLLTFILYIKLVKFSLINYLLIVVLIGGFVGLLQIDSISSVVLNMQETTQEQQSEGETYIRLQQFEFFTKTYPQNISYYLIGGGLPGAYGSYAAYMRSIVGTWGFYWVDLGLIGFYFVIGGVALLGILMYSFKSIFSNLPQDSKYLSFYFAYLLLVSLFTMPLIFYSGFFVIESIVFYLIDTRKDELGS